MVTIPHLVAALSILTLYAADAIIIGVSKMEHLKANMGACQEGPLDKRTLASA